MDKISKYTKKAYKKSGINNSINAAFVCNIAKKSLKNIFDKDFLKKIKIISFSRGFIYLSTPSSVYTQEIKLREE